MTTIARGEPMQAACGSKSKRKRYWVLPMFQTKIIVWLVGISAIVATTAAWVILLVVWAPVADQIIAGGEIDAGQLFRTASWRVLATTVLLVGVFAFVSFFTGIAVSHRIAGPLHRIGLIAAQISDGQYHARITLRRGDYIPEFAEKINQMLENLDRRMERQRQAISNVQKSLSEMENALMDGKLTSAETEKSIRDMLLRLQEVRLSEPCEEDTPSG